MADENETNTEATAVESGATSTAVEPKKRATRRTPAEMAAAAALKSQKAKRATKAVSSEKAKSTRAAVSAPGKPRAKTIEAPAVTARLAVSVGTPVTAADEMADLLKLEEENKRLRKTLSEKLRAENADLRKRLGQS